MAGLTVAHKVALAALFERCPDAMLKTLAAAVTPLPGGRAAEMRNMLAEEQVDRVRRQFVMAPLVPMFRNRPDGLEALTFPPSVLARLWKASSSREPELLSLLDGAELSVIVADRICLAAAAAVRDQPGLIWPGEDDPARLAGLDDLAACLDLAQVARRGLRSLEVWLKRPDGDQIAELRMLLKDCADIRLDGTQRVLEILFSHLDDAVLILRILTQTSSNVDQEDLLGASELAGFVDRLIAGVDLRAARITAFRPAADIARVKDIITDLTWCANVLGELDVTLTLSPQSPWGKSVHDGRLAIAGRLAALLRAADAAVDQALPMQRVQLAGRMTRKAPQLDAPIEGDTVLAACSLLRLVGSVRGPASTFGCEADRKTLVEGLTARLGDYADQLLHMVNEGEAPDESHAMKLIDFVAQCLELIAAEEAARTVRRRAAVAGPSSEGAEASSRAA